MIWCSEPTLNEWVEMAEVDGGGLVGVLSDMAEKTRWLEHEPWELRQANEILREASVYCEMPELDRWSKS